MKKAFYGIIIIFAMVLFISVFTNNNDLNTGDNEPESTYAPENTITPEPPFSTNESDTKENRDIIKISSDEYYDIVKNTILNHIEYNGYVISRISTLRMPYYVVECVATDIDTSNFKDDTLKIAENIYNDLIEYDYKKPSIFVASYKIISLSFEVVVNGKTTNSICIQFDLTDIDRDKTFLENLKLQL